MIVDEKTKIECRAVNGAVVMKIAEVDPVTGFEHYVFLKGDDAWSLAHLLLTAYNESFGNVVENI